MAVWDSSRSSLRNKLVCQWGKAGNTQVRLFKPLFKGHRYSILNE